MIRMNDQQRAERRMLLHFAEGVAVTQIEPAATGLQRETDGVSDPGLPGERAQPFSIRAHGAMDGTAQVRVYVDDPRRH